MRLYVLRHGQAEAQITSDEVRQLTAKGREETKKMLGAFAAQMQPLDAIWASPLIRAQQTARIAADFFPDVDVSTTDLLVPEASIKFLYNELANAAATTNSLLLVSHQPLVGIIVNQLCGEMAGFHAMGTSSLAAIEIELIAPSMGNLLWLHHTNEC